MADLKLHKVCGNLKELKLRRMDELLPAYLQEAERQELGLLDAMDGLTTEELLAKRERALNHRLKKARFPFVKTIEGFDFSFQSSISKKQIMELSNLGFVERKENLVLLGPPGVGKTHLSVAFGILACRAGYSTIFYPADELLQWLVSSLADNSQGEKLRRLSKSQVLIIDEIGYLPLNKVSANLFFQLVSCRYEKASIILTSNKSFSSWGELFSDSVIATAILDRLLHHAVVINIKGESYRLKDKRKILVDKERSNG